MSLTLTATILFVSLNASATIYRNRTLATEFISSQRLAGYFLDEISVLPIHDDEDPVFGLETGEQTSLRATWDDVDDYHGFRERGPTYRDGSKMQDYDNWTVEIEIDARESDGRSVPISTGTEGSLREIHVRVTSPSNSTRTYRTLVSSVPSDLPADRSFERLRRIDLDFSSSRSVELLVPLRNHPEPIY